MAGALAAQLKKLRISEENIEEKKHESLLFDPEGAKVDRETVFSIGQSGLQELVKFSPLFDAFKITLFSPSSVNFDRTILDAKVNESLDVEIGKFLLLLSPYFLLTASHKVLEWLINRYYIHKCNKNQFILLILPYHGTHMFVKALHLVDLSDENDKWYWLAPLQKRGMPLDSGTFISHLSTDDGLLQMLCAHVIAAASYSIQSREASDSYPTILYTFYANAMKGVIELSSNITETQMSCLLPALLYGLESSIIDLVSNSYAIIMKLITKVQFSPDIVEKLLLKAFKNTVLKREATILLLYLYQNPFNRLTVVPRSVVLQLSDLTWFVEEITKIHSSVANASSFVACFLQEACQITVENLEDSSNVQNMINHMLTSIKLDDDAVDTILSNTLTSKFLKNEMSQTIKDFFSKFYQTFEHCYSERFDGYLKNLMERDEKDLDSKEVLHFLTSCLFGNIKDMQRTVEILYKLTHVNPAKRISALKLLVENNISESCRDTMMSMLQARFHDEVSVVETLLSFPVERLVELLQRNNLINELLVLLSTCRTTSRKVLAKPALKILLELCEKSDDTIVFMTILPYLFPIVDEDIELTKEILGSNFAKNNVYIQHVSKEIEKSELANAEAISSAASRYFLNYDLLPPTENIVNSVRQQVSYGDATTLFFDLLLLGSTCKTPVGSMPIGTVCDIINMVTEIIRSYPFVMPLDNCDSIIDDTHVALKLAFQGILSLQAGTYVIEMAHRQLNIRSESKIDFDDNAERSYLILRVIEIFIEGMYQNDWRQHYSMCLQYFFQLNFATARDLICFLAQFYNKPVRAQTSYFCLVVTSLVLNKHGSVQWVFQDQDFIISLLISLARRNDDCRKVALEVLRRLTCTHNGTEPFFVLLNELAAKSTAIFKNPNQTLLNLRDLFLPNSDVPRQPKQRKKLQQAQKLLFDIVIQNEALKISLDRRSQLLDVLIYVNNIGILRQLIPLGFQFLKKPTEGPMSQSAGYALRNILQRFDGTTVAILNEESAWSFFERSIVEYEPWIITEIGEQVSPSIVLLRQIDETFFENAGTVNTDLQAKILGKILDVLTDCEIHDIIFVADMIIRQIHIDARIIRSELEMMKISSIQEGSTSPESKRKSRKRKKQQNQQQNQQVQLSNLTMVHSRVWERGVNLLKFVQQAENIRRKELLYDPLFDLMTVCLSPEEQSPFEYTNQLILSIIYQLMTSGLPVRDAEMQIILIVKCIGTSRNLQTHHFALLVLVELLKNTDLFRAVFKIMPIFTFLGSTLVCQDDPNSIEIVSKILETLVPIVNTSEEKHACELLTIFLISLPHMPEHRRAPFFIKLLQLLDNHRHLYYLLVFKSQAKITSEKTENSMEYLNFAVQISQELPLQRLFQICTKVIIFLKILPMDIEDRHSEKVVDFPLKHIYDLTKTTPKIFRHYKIAAVQCCNNILSSQDFNNRIILLSQEEIQEDCDTLATELIRLIEQISEVADQHTCSNKYCRVLLYHLYNMLNTVHNILPNVLFLKNTKYMLNHKLLSVRKKGLEILNTRLLRQTFNKKDHTDLLSLIELLMKFLVDTMAVENQDYDIMQSVLMCLKLLAKLLASDHPITFKPILDLTIQLLRVKDDQMLTTVIFCVSELYNSMGMHAKYAINDFVPVILDLIKIYCYQKTPNLVVVSLSVALRNMVETMGDHLKDYLNDILYELIMLSSRYMNLEISKGMDIIFVHARTTIQKISKSTSLRMLLPAVKSTYQTLLTNKLYQHIPSLMNILTESFANAQLENLMVEIDNFIDFFLDVLRFRENNKIIKENMTTNNDAEVTSKYIAILDVEESASKAFVVFSLKLKAETFKPLYNKFYEWITDTQYKQRNITFYRVLANLADELKVSFVSYVDLNSLKHAALLLNSNNTSITGSPPELTIPVESSRIELVEMILTMLQRIYNRHEHNSVCKDQFEILMQSIVNQLGNTIGTKEVYEDWANKFIVPSIVSFANAIPDKLLFKKLIQQILLMITHVELHAKTIALNVLVEIARKLSKNFIQLLPVIVPSLKKMLEVEETKKCTENTVCTLKEIIGEPLEKYF